jgi:hypothetical protein
LKICLRRGKVQKAAEDAGDTQIAVDVAGGVALVDVAVLVAAGGIVEVVVDTEDVPVAYALVCMALDMVLVQ